MEYAYTSEAIATSLAVLQTRNITGKNTKHGSYVIQTRKFQKDQNRIYCHLKTFVDL